MNRCVYVTEQSLRNIWLAMKLRRSRKSCYMPKKGRKSGRGGKSITQKGASGDKNALLVVTQAGEEDQAPQMVGTPVGTSDRSRVLEVRKIQLELPVLPQHSSFQAVTPLTTVLRERD